MSRNHKPRKIDNTCAESMEQAFNLVCNEHRSLRAAANQDNMKFHTLARKMFTSKAFISSEMIFSCSSNIYNNYAKVINAYRGNIYQKIIRRCSSQAYEKRLVSETFPMLINELIDLPVYGDFPDLKKRFRNLMDYSYAARPHVTSRLVLSAYNLLEKQENKTEEKLQLMRILACCTEMTNVSLLIANDCIENASNRRSIATWHANPDVGIAPIGNDAVIVENSIFYILKKYFSSHPKYQQIIELFHEATEHFFRGLYLQDAKCNVKNFTLSQIEKIAINTIGYRCYFLPVTVSLHLANVYEDYDYDKMQSIMSQIAVYCKVKNDFLDSFGDDGSNINTRKGRISWLTLKSQEKSDEARKCLMKNYGKDDEQSVGIVQNLYKQLNMPKEFEKYRRISFNSIQSLIESSCNVENKLMHRILEISYEDNFETM